MYYQSVGKVIEYYLKKNTFKSDLDNYEDDMSISGIRIKAQLDILDDVYENNDIHDIKLTEQLYKKHFKIDLNNEYEIIDIIGW